MRNKLSVRMLRNDATRSYHYNKDIISLFSVNPDGFKLKLNVRGGAGKIVTKRLIKFGNVPHVVVLRASTLTGTLRIIAYEPRCQRAFELR
jgi:hypothetical protein